MIGAPYYGGFLPQEITFGDYDSVLWFYFAANVILTVAFIRQAQLFKQLGKGGSARHIFLWIRPLVLACYGFFGFSAARCACNALILFLPIQIAQTAIFFLHALFVCAVVGLSEIHLRRTPQYIDRLARHRVDANRFRVIADYVPEGIIEIDTSSNIWYHNFAAAEMFGYGKDDFPLDAAELVPRELRPRHYEAMAAFAAIEPPPQGGRVLTRPTTVKVLRKDGSIREIDVSFSEYQIGDTRRYVAVFREHLGTIE